MNSRERVRAAVRFREPDKLPFNMSVSGYSDVFVTRGFNFGPRAKILDGDRVFSKDHFGCLFEMVNEKTMGLPTRPPLAELSKLDSFQFPDPRDDSIYHNIASQLARSQDQYNLDSTIWFTFFERIHFLHGFDQTLIDLLTAKEDIKKLIDKVSEFNIQVVKEIGRRFPGQIHGINLSDDWGTQNATIIGQDLFREMFAPGYKELFDTIHSFNMDVWLHSCGNVINFLPDLIELGVDAINFQQPRIFDLDVLHNFSGQICFNTPVDIQSTMPGGSKKDIYEEAELLINKLATEKGGFVANEHGDYQGNGIDPIKGKWAYQAFRKFDPYNVGNNADY